MVGKRQGTILSIKWYAALAYVFHVDASYYGAIEDGVEMDRMHVPRHVFQRFSSARATATHDYFNVFLKRKTEIEELECVDLPNARVLIIGCGYHYPDVSLWSSVSKSAVGVDVRTAYLRNRFAVLNHSYVAEGKNLAESIARSAFLRWTYKSYYDHLRLVSDIPLNEHRQEVIAYDGIHLPFIDESFDIVCSNAVLEHVSNLDAVSEEIRRITRPSGICYHLWHNYNALSGAHVPEDIARSSPWGHLTGDSQVQEWLNLSETYLNKMSAGEIIDVLSQAFETVRISQLDKDHNRKGIDDAFEYEGADLFTKDLESKLYDHTKEDLLTRAYSFIGVRR